MYASIVCCILLAIAGMAMAGQNSARFDEMISAMPGARATVRQITRGPKFHFFGYYDKLQFDPTGRYVLGMQVDFDCRPLRGDEVMRIGMVDLQDGDRWIELGETRAWCWQQGCHLQWRPGSDREILFNDREGGRFVCRVLDVKTRKMRTLPHAADNISPDGRWALGVDFARINWGRPGYGYAGVEDRNRNVRAPEDSGVYRLDLDSGEYRMLVSCARVAAIPHEGIAPTDSHYINHVQWSPDGRRFLFLNRTDSPQWGRYTRMFTAAADGSDLRLVDVGSSHYVWRDPRHILIWNNGYRLYRDDGSLKGELVWDAPNGHHTYLPGNEWLITDTYPIGPQRRQHLYLYHIPTGRIVPAGSFNSPEQYNGEWRCDLHPRLSPDAKRVCIDSVHGTDGRQMWVVEISGLLKQ